MKFDEGLARMRKMEISGRRNESALDSSWGQFSRTSSGQAVILFAVLSLFTLLCCSLSGSGVHDGNSSPVPGFVAFPDAPTTLQGPFTPKTVPFNESLGFQSEDLTDTNPLVVRRATGWQPEQISLAASPPDAMYVSWVTGEAKIGINVVPLDPTEVGTVVEYGLQSGKLTLSANGIAEVYNQLYPFEGLFNYTSGIIHHVKVSGLLPSTTYFYRVGDPSLQIFSRELSFTTLPRKGPASYPSRIGVIGDLGLTFNSTSTIAHMKKNSPDLVLLVGDLVYADLYVTNGTGSNSFSRGFPDAPIHETYQPRWDLWGRFMESLISTVPLMIIEGNHEKEIQGNDVTYLSYQTRFSVPFKESGSPNSFYYSFDAGGIHFLMLGAYIDYSKTSEQYAWLKQDLAKVDRSVTPWLVATWHPPWYTSYVSHYREVECMRIAMEELLYNHGVDLVLNGHVHAYERMNRVYNYTLDNCGPVYITVGDGGNHEHAAIPHTDEPGMCPTDLEDTGDSVGGYCGFNFTSGPAAGSFCWNRQPDWSAFRETSFGHGMIEVVNSTHLFWTWHRNQDLYNAVGDQIFIVRQPGVCPNQPPAG